MKNVETPLIYIVEDDQFYAEMLKMQLENFGHKKLEVLHSGKALSENLYKQPDIVLLDYNLGDTTGLEILKKIKAYNPNIQVVFLSGQDDLQIAVNCLKYGAYDYVVKNDKTANRIQFLIRKIIQINRFIEKNQTEAKARKLGLVTVGIAAALLIGFLLN